MSKRLSPIQAAGLTLLVLLIMFVARRLGRAGRSVRSAIDDIAAPTAKVISDIVDGPDRP
jgi:hypothetical protein